MTARHYFHDGSVYTEITDRIDERGLEVRENAEEGSVAMSTILIDDPDMDLWIVGHRGYIIKEDSVPAGTEDRIFNGYTADRAYIRGRLPTARQIRLTVTDLNVVWGRRVMVGSDCKRPAESDVTRMQWLVTTAEAGLIDDTTYLSTASPTTMDACDYRGQMMSSVADDCAQASGKNWYITSLFVTGGGFAIWYGKEGLAVYDSDLSLSNDLADIDYDTVFPYSEDAELNIDPSRVFSGVYIQRENGANYRERPATATAFARRDAVMPSGNVKTSAKAIARAERYLDDLDEEDLRFQASVILPAEKVNMIRPGMRIPVRGTHFPAELLDPDSFYWMRVLWRSVKYWTPTDYIITMELSPGAIAPGPPYTCPLDHSIHGTPSDFYGPLGSATADSRGNILYSNSNRPAYPFYDPYTMGPQPLHLTEGLGFQDSGIGGDAGGTGTNSVVYFVFAGSGTASFSMELYDAVDADWSWNLTYSGPSGSTTEQSDSGLHGGDSATVVTGPLPSDAAQCWRVLTIWIGINLSNGGTKLVFPGITWVAS